MSTGIKTLIQHGESDTVEFKEKVPTDETLARVVTSFANHKGGHIFVGVSDTGEILGLSENQLELAYNRSKKVISNLLSHSGSIKRLSIDGKDILQIEIPEAPAGLKPVTNSHGIAYQRSVSKDLILKALYKEKVSTSGKTKKKVRAFIAMSFREEEEPSLVDFFEAMKRAASNSTTDIDIRRIDLHEGDYEISSEIMKEIDICEVVVADFTLSPHNVYFEVGYARAKNKTIIQTAKKDTVLQFDVRNWRTLFYKNATELEKKLTEAFNNL